MKSNGIQSFEYLTSNGFETLVVVILLNTPLILLESGSLCHKTQLLPSRSLRIYLRKRKLLKCWFCIIAQLMGKTVLQLRAGNLKA